MSAYRDSCDWKRDGVTSGHLIADSKEELENLAAILELPKRLYQIHAVLPHYQLPVAFQEAAAALGVIYLERTAFKRQVDTVLNRWDANGRRSRNPNSPEQRRLRTTKTETTPVVEIKSPIQPSLI